MKRSYSALDGSSANQHAKSISSPLLRRPVSTPPSASTTALPADWQEHRDVNPVQRKIALDFNYWMETKRMDIKGIHDLIRSLVTGQKAACLGQALSEVKHVAFVTISEFNHDALATHLSGSSFLSNCSSVPTLLVERSDLPNLSSQYSMSTQTSPSYDWYYNDVKDMNTLLLWPYVPRIMAKGDTKLAGVIEDHLVTFKGMGMDWIDYVTLLPHPAVSAEVQVIITNLTDQLPGVSNDNEEDKTTDHQKLSPAMQTLLHEVGKEGSLCVFGRVYRHRSSEGGLFVFLRKNDTAAMEKLLVIWEKGEISVLSISPSYSLTYLEEEGEMQMTLHSLLPLAQLHPPAASSAASTPAPSRPSSQSLVEEVCSLFSSLPAQSMEALVLGREVSALCGYMLSKDGFLCMETHSPLWRDRALRKEAGSAESKKVCMDVEEGEVEEGEEVEETAAHTSGSSSGLVAEGAFDTAHRKLQSQAQTYLQPLSPLDYLSLDCEMCMTDQGLEVCRVSLLHPVRGIVLDTLIKPAREVKDYLTEFSGVTEEALKEITITLADLHHILPQFISARTIIIGHSLEGDLRALHLVHIGGRMGGGVVDVSALYTHPSSLPYRLPLKRLAREVLGRDIQDSETGVVSTGVGLDAGGHDSVQDAAAALLLALYYLKREEAANGAWGAGVGVGGGGERFYFQQPRYTLFEHVARVSDSHKWHVNVAERAALPHLRRWEADALGYRHEGSATCAAKQFQGKASSSPACTLNQVSIHTASLSAGPQDIHDFSVSSNPDIVDNQDLRCLQYWQLSLAHYKDKADAENKVNSYQTRYDHQDFIDDCLPDESNHVDDSHAFNLMEEDEGSNTKSYIRDLDNDLQRLYASLPESSVMLVFTQNSLVDLRKLIASKTRNKWQVQQAARGQKISLPIDAAYKGRRIGTDWHSEDEATLLQEAQKTAHGCMFICLK